MLKVHELPMSLGKVSRAIHRHTESCCKKYGITAYQYVLLLLLAEDDGVTQQDLVIRADSDPNTMRAMLILLEKKGMIKRDRHTSDVRRRHVILTKKGLEIYKKAFKEIEPVREILNGVLSVNEQKKLLDMLGRMLTSLDELTQKNNSEQKNKVRKRKK